MAKESEFSLLLACAKLYFKRMSCPLEDMESEDYQSPYGTVVTVLLAFVIISINIVVVFGNILVIVAVSKSKSLKSVPNLI